MKCIKELMKKIAETFIGILAYSILVGLVLGLLFQGIGSLGCPADETCGDNDILMAFFPGFIVLPFILWIVKGTTPHIFYFIIWGIGIIGIIRVPLKISKKPIHIIMGSWYNSFDERM